MLIAIEGVDRTGKSTLADNLATRFKLESQHFDKPQDHPLIEYLKPIEDAPVRKVFDRYHWGERVWPGIFGRPTEYDDAMHTYVELVLQSRGAVMVLAQRDIDEIVHACHQDGEPVQGQDVFDSAMAFKQVYDDSRLDKFKWELGDSKRLDEIIKRAKCNATWADAVHGVTPRWVGDVTPNILLVGEQVGPGGQGEWTLPFVPFKNTSGHFLMSELLLKPDLLNNIAIINAKTPNGEPERIAEAWEQLGCPPIVALGAIAFSECMRQGLGCVGHVHHPQYVRRFLRKNGPGWYADEIEKESMTCA